MSGVHEVEVGASMIGATFKEGVVARAGKGAAS
jgi:hypothetical protein